MARIRASMSHRSVTSTAPEAPAHPANRAVADVAITSDGRRGVTVGFDGTVRLWDLDRVRQIAAADLTHTLDSPRSVRLAPDERSVLVGTTYGVLLRFELPER